jgi:hexulose-6-phosphate isomerase
MKKSINAWSVDDSSGFDEMFRALREAGFEGIELNVDNDDRSAHSLTLEKGTDLGALAKLSQKYDLPVVGISTSLGGGTGLTGEGRARAQKVIRRQIECARALGAKTILSVPGNERGQISLLEGYRNSLECYKEIGDEIAASGVSACLEEVSNGFFTSAFDMARFIDDLNNPYIAAYFDVGNVVSYSWPEYWIEILDKRIRAVHVKDFKREGRLFKGGVNVDLGEGDVEWGKVMPALKKAGFDSYLTAETFIAESKVPGISFPAYYQTVSDALGRIIALPK